MPALRRFQGNRAQAYPVARQALRQARHGQWGERAEARVAADGLTVVEQHDGLAIAGYLDGAQRHAFGDHRLACALQHRTAQTDAHAVGALVDREVRRVRLSPDGKLLGQESLLKGLGERIRDVRVAPDGSVWVTTDDPAGKLIRISR